MSVPIEFTSGLAGDLNQSVSSYILAPKTSVPRNINTKLDDLGLYANVVRRDGESTTNFRSRLLRTQTLRGSSDRDGLINSVCNELGLGQTYLITATATLNEVELEVNEVSVIASFSGVIQKQVNFINPDVDGIWVAVSVSGIVSGLQNVSGLNVQWVSGYDQLPAFLLEPQTSVIPVFNEHVPLVQSYTLGVLSRGDIPPGPVLIDSVSFNDRQTYKTQITGTPAAEGEWSVDVTGRINVFSNPLDITLASYKYNLLGSGLTMGLVGNGARLFNLASEDIQELMFTVSGIGESAREFLFDIRSEDRNFWGK
jgi:hypothetical protein